MNDQLENRYVRFVNGTFLLIFFLYLGLLILNGRAPLACLSLVLFIFISDLANVLFVLRLKKSSNERNYLTFFARSGVSLASLILFYYCTVENQLSPGVKLWISVFLAILFISSLFRLFLFRWQSASFIPKGFFYATILILFSFDLSFKVYYYFTSKQISLNPISNHVLTVIQGGGGIIGNHHFSFAEQRYACDIARYKNGANISMGIPINSPCKGTVEMIHLEDKNTTRDNIDPAGTYVVIKNFELNYFVMIAHLKSVSVTLNSSVREGQEIGICGDSGNTDNNPHVHIQVQTSVDYKSTENRTLPFRFKDILPLPGKLIMPP